jgi:hypothetical protein
LIIPPATVPAEISTATEELFSAPTVFSNVAPWSSVKLIVFFLIVNAIFRPFLILLFYISIYINTIYAIWFFYKYR